MRKRKQDKLFDNIPTCATEFIKLVIKKMRYRRKVRVEVMAELAAHFEDELKDCKTDEEREQKAQQLIAEFGDVKLLAVLLRRAKKRCRGLWRTIIARTFQAVGVLIICFILYVAWFLTGKPVITTDYVAELNRMVRPVADESLNATPSYDEAITFYIEEPNNLRKFADWPKDLSDEQTIAIKNWIKDNEACFEQIKLASKKPHYWRRYESESGTVISVRLPSLNKLKKLARLIVWRIKMRAYQGQVKGAIGDILICYRMGMHFKVPTFIIEQLVGFSVEMMATNTALMVLSETDVDGETLADFQQRFQKLVEKNNFTVQFGGEKLCLYDEIQRCFTDDRFGNGHLYPKRIMGLIPLVEVVAGLPATREVTPSLKKQEPNWLSEFMSNVRHEICEHGGFIYETGGFVKKGSYLLFLHPDKIETARAAEQFYDYWEKHKVKTPARIRAEGIDTEKKALEIVKGNILLEMLAPAFNNVCRYSHLNKANAHALVTILALLRYEDDNHSYPENLEELITTGHLKELPTDPYSDKPLIYKKTDDNFTLYSVGLNFKDDGGKPGRDEKGRVRKWAGEGDVVFWPAQKK